jgi:hypothetical protein
MKTLTERVNDLVGEGICLGGSLELFEAAVESCSSRSWTEDSLLTRESWT